jgi:sugar phosphate isomerase/epimerase
MTKIFLHSWNYRDESFESAVARAAEFGYDGIEVYGGHFPDSGDQVAGLEHVHSLGERGGVPVAVAPLGLDVLTRSPDERVARLDAAVRVIEAAGRLGIPRLNAMIGWLPPKPDDETADGSAVATEEHFAAAIELAGTLAETAAGAGVEITLETHMRTIHDTAAATLRILDGVGSPHLRANFDAGNMFSITHAEDADEALDVLKERITYVHLKNCRELAGGFDYHWPLAGGDLDYRRIVGAIVETGFDGPYCIEYSGGGDRDHVSRADLEYLRGLLADLGAS